MAEGRIDAIAYRTTFAHVPYLKSPSSLLISLSNRQRSRSYDQQRDGLWGDTQVGARNRVALAIRRVIDLDDNVSGIVEVVNRYQTNINSSSLSSPSSSASHGLRQQHADPKGQLSAFATLEEDAVLELIIHDAVRILVDAVGSTLQTPALVNILILPLLKRREKLKGSDVDFVHH